MSWASWWLMVGWIAYMGRFLRDVGGRCDRPVVVLPCPATGPASDLGIVCIAELVADPALPVVDEHTHDVGVLLEHVLSFRGTPAPGRRDVDDVNWPRWGGRVADR